MKDNFHRWSIDDKSNKENNDNDNVSPGGAYIKGVCTTIYHIAKQITRDHKISFH